MNTTKERPILFSVPMVRAILDGRKTQTRRVVKPQPLFVADPNVPFKTASCDPKGIINCPYGKPCDRLWVRETFAIIDDESGYGSAYIEYKASCDKPERIIWKPSIHMPRWASRILLEVTNVRVDKLRDISEEDAMAEGYISTAIVNDAGDDYTGEYAAEAFRTLWKSPINGQGSWDLNPWVWVVEFKVLEINEK
ncbi:MAG: hypothetical protein LV471_09135 [Nitrosomonas sp.]|nr:hypothetical protein [Nitrosomonas sp.]